MKLDCVLTACTDDPLYASFIPIFIRAWKKLYASVDIKIIFISDSIPIYLEFFKENIILFKPIANISPAFISQYIRLLYPALLNYDNGILITDIDILPMNRKYFTKNIETLDNNKFVYLRDALLTDLKQVAMCYNVATNKIWSEIFNIGSIEDLTMRLIDVNSTFNYKNSPDNSGWFKDQTDLYYYVTKWNEKTNNFISLSDKETGFNRLDRGEGFTLNDANLRNAIVGGKYTDYHCLRPYHKYKLITDSIVYLL